MGWLRNKAAEYEDPTLEGDQGNSIEDQGISVENEIWYKTNTTICVY